MRIVGLGIIALAMMFGASVAASTDAAAQAPGLTATKDISAQRRQRARITVYPRRQALGPNAVRQCQTRLTQEYRPSGTVIFPRMYCWWE